VNVSELGLVTPAGKVVWGKIICYLYFGCYIMVEISTDIDALDFVCHECR